MKDRPRRLRKSPAIRRLVRETRISPAQLVLPVFVCDEPGPIATMPGVSRVDVAGARQLASEAVGAGLGGIMVFGVPAEADKDPLGTQGWVPEGIAQRAVAAIKDAVGDETVIMVDTCLDEYTDHGHCGVLTSHGLIDEAATLEIYGRMAQVQADAGADVVSPSGMMDDQVEAIRDALDQHGRDDVAILAYAAKYASAFYGPFRDAVGSSLQGDRRTYQQDPANRREGRKEVVLDLDQGADLVMVKPAGYYLDVIADAAQLSDVPVVAYQVSGEYAAIEAAAERGWLDRRATIEESVTAIVRAGADIVLTYWALELARWIND